MNIKVVLPVFPQLYLNLRIFLYFYLSQKKF